MARKVLKNGLRAVIRLTQENRYNSGNLSISGVKGSGKDVLTGNIIARSKRKYISNIDYTKDDRFIPLELLKFNINNTYENFISGYINKYVYPYDDKINVYISDAGNYFPCQYDSQLNKKYPFLASWASLQRQLGLSVLTMNSQSHSRVWKILREQCCDHFIRCDRCIVLFGKIVFATYYYYDKEQSCLDRVKPCRIRKPLLASSETKMNVEMYLDKFYNTYGNVEKHWYICWNKSKHDSRAFKTMLEKGSGTNGENQSVSYSKT